MLTTTASAKPCDWCHADFMPRTTLHAFCRPACFFKSQKSTEKLAIAQRKKDKAALQATWTTKEWMPRAQEAFNKYVRFRDINAGHGCIDCGKPFEPQKFGGSVDAGHYLSRGSAPHLKFDERNVFAQRKNCNKPGGTTRAAFRAGVIARIGLEAVEALEADQSTRKYRADDLKALRDEYRKRLKTEMEKQ